MTRRLSLAGQLLALQVVIIFVVLVGVTAVTVAQSTLGAHEFQGRRAQAVAETLAGSRALRNSLAGGGLAYAVRLRRRTTRSRMPRVARSAVWSMTGKITRHSCDARDQS